MPWIPDIERLGQGSEGDLVIKDNFESTVYKEQSRSVHLLSSKCVQMVES